MNSVDRHRLGYSPLTNRVYLYRHGKDPNAALEKRDALNEVLTTAARFLSDHDTGAVALEMGDRTLVLSVHVAPPEPAPADTGRGE